MKIKEIIPAVITGLISIVLFIYSFFTFREKGPILSNTFLLATEEERKNIDKSAEYHLITIVFGILGIIFLLFTIEILTSYTWLSYIRGLFIIIVIIYAIVESIKTGLKK